MKSSVNPLVTQAPEYPFARLLEQKRQREASGHPVLDFGMGDPREPTPAFLRKAVADAIPEVSSYPTVKGSAELRASIAGYLQRRFGLSVDPDRHVLPLNGTKEGLFHCPLAFIDPHSERKTVITLEPSYPVYARGAGFAGAVHHPMVLTRKHGFRPDFDALDPELLSRTQILFINYPHNPTGAELSAEEYARLVSLARTHDFILVSDECYSDLYFDAPPPCALVAEDAPDFRSVLAFHSCSKRSAMTGYRSGFVVGDPDLIALLARFRPSVGVATPAFVQAAATAAWNDDDHARAMAETYRRRRDVFLELFRKRGWHHDGGAATFYLWWRVPDGLGDSVQFAKTLLERDVLVTPGSYLGEGGEGHVRIALVATEEDCQAAVEKLADL